MNSKVDLRQLAVNRDQATPGPVASPAQRRRVLSRFVLPAAPLVGFVALLGFAVREAFVPPRSVTVLPVISSQSMSEQPSDTPLFRAAGWVEPRPTATLVTALSEGIVDKLFVVEGQEIKEGDIVARLVTADARIALEAALAEAKLREAELSAATASLTAAKTRLAVPLHLQIELADAAAALAKAETELGNLPFLLRAAQARQRFAQEEFAVNKRTIGAVAALSVLKAQTEMEAADATVEELQGRQKRLPVEVAALKDKRDAMSQKIELKTEEIRVAGEAAAAEQAAKARVSQAESVCDAARLRLARMEIRAPCSGRVLALVAKPGTRLMGQDPRTLHDASSVVLLYDPTNLQIRVDVRLDDIGKVIPGQKVTIESAALPGKRLEGHVLATTSQADIQKNTLSVKVAITEPPANLKPEMLCQVVFLAMSRPFEPATKKGAETHRLLVPKQLVESAGDGGRVWTVDLPNGVARLRTVQLGSAAGDLVEVLSGLGPTDWLIVSGRDGLKAGERVAVSGEDETLGMTRAVRGKK